MTAMRRAVVDLGAVTRNIAALHSTTATPVMAVVKANGYGHGAVEVARAALAGGATWLGVVDVAEALALRAAGIDAPVLSWLHGSGTDFAPAVAAGIDLGVNHLAQLEQIAAAGSADVHIKVDTGLGRNGVVETEWAPLFARAAEFERAGRVRVRGLFSHLANAGDDADAAQVATFERAIAAAASAGLAPTVRHLAATAGAIARPEARYDLVRIGIGMYGISPFGDGDARRLGLTPAMELGAEVVSVKRVPAGSGVSYGHDWVADRETTLALVPLGYADGVPRQARGASVLLAGARHPVVGRIAMDQFVVDVGDAPVAIGDRAVLFGDPATGAPSATEWADAAGTIDYDIVARVGARVTREYV